MPYIIGIIGIAFWLRMAKIVTPLLGSNKYVNIIADNTYPIMINHLLGFMVVKTIFALFNKYTSFAAGFDVTAYKTYIWYYYLPHNMQQFLLIYVLFAIPFSILLGYLFTRIGNFLVNLLKKCYNCSGDKKGAL